MIMSVMSENTVNKMVIGVGGKQYVVVEGDKITVNRLADKVDSTLTTPDLLSGKAVKLKVLEEIKGEKINGRRFKNKIHYLKRYGHRSLLSVLEVLGEAKAQKAEPATESKPAEKVVAKKAVKKAEPKKKTVTKKKND